MGVVRRIGGRCKRCYTCVRNCPVKAISVENGEANVLDEFCVNCGTCVRGCNQKAKQVVSQVDAIMEKLAARDREVVALIAPSFPASFFDVQPKQVVAAFKKAGFQRVVEVAYGAELVAREAKRLLLDPHVKKPLISSPCPVVVSLIEMHFPEIMPHLMPVVSPLLATGRYLESEEKEKSIKVFIGPCVAKKAEIAEPALAGVIDYAMTFREAKEMFETLGITVSSLPGIPMDSPHPGQGRVFPLVGGILKAADIGTDILDPRVAIIEGHHETMEFLRTFQVTPPRQEIIDILFCRGCIDGVEVDSPLPYLEKQRKVAEFVAESRHLNPSSLPEINLKRDYFDKKIRFSEPIEEEIIEILRMFGKTQPEDELNCGACGYPTCREKARAVYHGFAEIEMCLPEIIKHLERTCEDLKISNEQLTRAQEELVHSEKLASLGQLSAGVAHELNNPLGGILLFSNLLIEKLRKSIKDTVPEEMDVIVKEATRCRHIVRGLLDFARQSKLQRTKMDLTLLLGEIAAIERRAAPETVTIQETYDPTFPACFLDPVQIRQALTNIIHNAVEAMPDGGVCTIKTKYNSISQMGEVTVSDSGVGIPESSIPKLFTPFYTTKGIGKGTGLGLAISYGIVKMHRGGINVKSEVGKGTVFAITIPVETAVETDLSGWKNGNHHPFPTDGK